MTIDLRSDTVTRPTPAMRRAMADAEVGDDVFGDDPTVHALETRIAVLLGKEAAVFVTSGTQSNLAAILAHCERGDEYIAGQSAHCYRYEAGGAAVLGSVQPQPIANAGDGSLPLEAIAEAIKPDDAHFARTRLLCLENTIGGKVLGLDYLADATALARRHGLATHLDGARLFNAATALGVEARAVAAPFDTVSVCFSKGLGAPMGSALVGDRATVERARRWRKMLGGGLRQAGVVAAAALHALEHHVGQLALDHAHAARFADALAGLDGLTVVEPPQTNMVFVRIEDSEAVGGLAAHLAASDVLALVHPVTRFVTHRDVDADGVDRAAEAIRTFFR